ncbi:MAG TPA: glycosyl hydrolase family 28-related protein [Fimbriimonadaceae bacterium]|nr:glycosyl hydrolase family 28-related protein [Fimbriimonadaceae bacterium]
MRLVLPLLLLASLASAQELNVRNFGAMGDGKTDDTAAFQRAMAKAAEGKGLTVYAPPGNYVFKSSLSVPVGVCLRGSWQSVPSHNGLRDAGLPKPTDDGTTFLIETGEGAEDGAFLTLNTNGTLKGVVIYYPDQNRSGEPKPYPYAIAMRGKNPAVLDVELLNPYNGIDASQNERHLIRNVDGQPLRRGIYVDAIYDIGRIENVHFNPWWSMEPALFKWQQEHGEAFIIGRSDWQYMTNTFCFGYNVGYHFVQTKNGICNGNFLGLGADDCFTAVQVDQCAPFGLLITNGEFVSFHGPDPTMVRVLAGNTGSVRFSNCAFWGPCNQIARIEGKGTVGFSDCTFVQWKKTAIEALGGTTLLRGCEFREDGAGVHAGSGSSVVISDCVGPGSTRIEADAGSHVKGPK